METEFIALTDDGERMTCRMPADETLVEVRLKGGATTLAYYSCNIMESGDYDFMPVDQDGEPTDGDSLISDVEAWRPYRASRADDEHQRRMEV